jgi:DNA-binding CsgD family transcriptional regulator
MAQTRLAFWSFVEACEQAVGVLQVKSAYEAGVSRLGFENFGLCSHVDPLRLHPQAVVFFRAPKGWAQRYRDAGYHKINPIHEEARRRATPFPWRHPGFRERLSPIQRRYMLEMAEAGISDGLTFPVRSPGALPASCSFSPGPDGVEESSYSLAHSMAVFAHECARRLLGAPVGADAPPLTERERQCLTLAARGKSDWAISELLGLSEGAVHKTIERAKRRLGVATRVQAIVRAIHAGQILLADVME